MFTFVRLGVAIVISLASFVATPAWAGLRYGASCDRALAAVEPELIVERARGKDIHWAQLEAFVAQNGEDASTSLLDREEQLRMLIDARREFARVAVQMREFEGLVTKALARFEVAVDPKNHDRTATQVGVWGWFKIASASTRSLPGLVRLARRSRGLELLDLDEGLRFRKTPKDGTLGNSIRTLENGANLYRQVAERAESVVAVAQAKIDGIAREMARRPRRLDVDAAQIVDL